MYLKELDLPVDGIIIRHKDETDTEFTLSVDTRLQRITDAVMESNLSPEAKIEVYKIIKANK